MALSAVVRVVERVDRYQGWYNESGVDCCLLQYLAVMLLVTSELDAPSTAVH